MVESDLSVFREKQKLGVFRSLPIFTRWQIILQKCFITETVCDFWFGFVALNMQNFRKKTFLSWGGSSAAEKKCLHLFRRKMESKKTEFMAWEWTQKNRFLLGPLFLMPSKAFSDHLLLTPPPSPLHHTTPIYMCTQSFGTLTPYFSHLWSSKLILLEQPPAIRKEHNSPVVAFAVST